MRWMGKVRDDGASSTMAVAADQSARAGESQNRCRMRAGEKWRGGRCPCAGEPRPVREGREEQRLDFAAGGLGLVEGAGEWRLPLAFNTG